jgi:Family of unknown function (DUF5678)
MSIQEAERLQEELTPKDDLRPYAGQWIALRDGHVVASDLDPIRLREKPEVQPNDIVIPVSDPEGGYFL